MPCLLDCNRNKGANFGSFDPDTDEVTLLFNPRKQHWKDHFGWMVHGLYRFHLKVG